MAEVLTSSMVVDNKSLHLLESEGWNVILDALSARYISVYAADDTNRPKWLDVREELSNLCLSLSTEPLTPIEMKKIAQRIASEHGFRYMMKRVRA